MATGNQPAWVSLLRAMRPNQWTKNLVIFAAFIFAFWDQSRTTQLLWQDLYTVAAAALLFCLASSGVYVLNDLHDKDVDRHHPLKRLRPIAAGDINTAQAVLLAVICLVPAIGLAMLLSPAFTVALTAYVGLQVAYTFILKQLALVDIIVIASGFVIRAIAGALALDGVNISPWLLLCTFLLALFLALCKRRHEKRIDPDASHDHRPSLEKYDARLLDQLIAITAGATIVAYSIYTLWPETVDKFGTKGLGFTIPFVVFGIFRYLDLAYRHEQAGRPERILLTDIPILVNLGLYTVTLLIVFLMPH